VTLGAKRFTLDDHGNPINVPRHPIIEDHVVIYANANILGRITIGAGSVIGGNVWLTTSIPPNTRITQQKAIEDPFMDGLGI
jgi:serine O-acetyltransferase